MDGSKDTTPGDTATEGTKDEQTSEDGGWYNDMLKASVISTGNNERLKKVIEKARKGEDVYIGAIGGSIKEGAGATSFRDGYADQFYHQFRSTYGTDGGKNVHFVDAGLGGTPSSLGVMRYQRDVVEELAQLPDLVIVEFAVNDYEEVTKGRAYRSMVHDILSQENSPAVVLLFSVFKNKWNQQENYVPDGMEYELPMVSIKDAIVKPYEDGHIKNDQFFFDDFHPKTFGHKIMSDCLMELLKTVDSQESDAPYTVPQTAPEKIAFFNMHLLTSEDTDVVSKVGSFTATDKEIQRFGTGKESFPNNWKHDATAGNKSFTMKLHCKNLLLNYKQSSSVNFGTAEVLVDGKVVQTIEGKTDAGWNNCFVVMILDEEKAKDHSIEVRMAKGQEDKEFTILSFGYTK